MEIANLISEDYVEFEPETKVSKIIGSFDDPSVKGVIIHGDEYEGIVTRRQLSSSRHHPDEKAGSLVWHVPQLNKHDDVRLVAQLMIDSDSLMLPVFEGRELIGVITADTILSEVQEFLDAATVSQAYTSDLVTVGPKATIGSAVHEFRTNNITHLPVVEDNSAVGILSLYDITAMTVRAVFQSQGGDVEGVDSFGGPVSSSSGRARRGGFGAREGELDRILDLPVRDVMIDPVESIHPDETLDLAVESMFEIGGSSLIVSRDGEPFGIITKKDILESLTWEAGGNRSVQVYNTELLDDIQYDKIVQMIDSFDDKDHGMSVLDAKIHLHEHDEKLRGTPLILARIRLHTDRGMYIASGEGYGASHAINEARDVLERQIRDQKTYARTKKPPNEEFWDKRFGWLLEE